MVAGYPVLAATEMAMSAEAVPSRRPRSVIVLLSARLDSVACFQRTS